MKTTVPLKISLFLLTFGASGAIALAGPSSGQTTDTVAHSSRSSQTLPTALRPALYQAFAKDAGPAYEVDRDGCAVLPKQSLKACFDSHGAHFSGSSATPLMLHLVAFGRLPARQTGDAKLMPLTPVRPVISGNRVSYAHGALTEWWRVLPVGFEQGFTLTKRPSGNGELTLALAANGQAKQDHGMLGWGKLRYGKLVVTDADGKVIPATLTSKGDRVLIAVNDTHAAYPLTVDPLVWLEQKISAGDNTTGEIAFFGYTAAISGKTAIVGEQYDTVGGNQYQGSAYVFTESDGIWTQAAKLTASDGAPFDSFGYSVALDGTIAVVGARGATVNGNSYQGAAYVFTESGGTWTQTAKLTASDGAVGDEFGWSVAVSGTTVLVGAFLADVNGNPAQGAAYVFTESNGTWNQTAKLTASDGEPSDQFGFSVALDGSAAIVGAALVEINENLNQGAAYTFTESNGTWTQTAKLIASGGSWNEEFGSSVAILGTTALVGAPAENDHTIQGAAYVFTESDGDWTQAAKLTASDGAAGDQFGWAVAISGTTALVGANYATVDGNASQGAAYVFDGSSGSWVQMQKLTASDGGAGQDFGQSVGISGTNALVGALFATVNGNAGQGAAYFYGESDLGLAMSAPQTVGQGQNYVSQTIATNNASVASPAVAATMTVPAAASFISAAATQGSCSEASGVVTCNFGPINGNAGTATANVTLKATGNVGDTIENVAGIAKATPPLSVSAPTTITEGGACPEGYTEYDGTLDPGGVARSPVYQAPSGEENAILTAPGRFQLYAVYQSGRFGRHVYLVPGNEVHRWAPKGLYMWLVRARDGAGAYTLCLQHP